MSILKQNDGPNDDYGVSTNINKKSDILKTSSNAQGEQETQVDKNYVNLNKALYVSVMTMVLFMAFGADQSLESILMRSNGYKNLGFTILALLNLFMAIFSVVSHAIIKKLGQKNCLIIGAITVSLFCVSQILPAWKDEYPAQQDSSGFKLFM